MSLSWYFFSSAVFGVVSFAPKNCVRAPVDRELGAAVLRRHRALVAAVLADELVEQVVGEDRVAFEDGLVELVDFVRLVEAERSRSRRCWCVVNFVMLSRSDQ